MAMTRRCSAVLALIFLGFTVPAWCAQSSPEPILEGVVRFSIEYEEVGPMAAMMPKEQSIYFRPGQQREEMGTSVTLLGVEDGKRIQLLDLGEQRVAFVMPASESQDQQDLRLEITDQRADIAGVEARQVELVDPLDPSNRLPAWVTDRIAASSRLHPSIQGFALDFYRPVQDGLGHWRATEVEARQVEEQLFVIPEGYQRIELESPSQMSAKLGELLGGQVEVIE